MGEFNFNGDDVGQCNVIKERIKRMKTVGAMRGMCVDSILVVQICCLILMYDFVPVLHHKFVFSICSTNFFYLKFCPHSFHGGEDYWPWPGRSLDMVEPTPIHGRLLLLV